MNLLLVCYLDVEGGRNRADNHIGREENTIKGLLLGMLACTAMVACTNDDIVENEGGNTNSDSKAYVAVKIVTTGTGSRVLEGFEDGTGNESKVNSARFYFFDNTGATFPVSDEGTNYIDVNIDENNISNGNSPIEKTATMLVLNAGKGVPSQIVAILNHGSASLGTSSKSLSDLRGTAAEYTSTGANQFVMSNSVYANGAEVIDAVKLEPGNICTSEKEAMDAPVSIYVERVLAKVAASSKTGITNNTFDTGETVEEKKIYAQIKGYQVTTTKPTSYLIKQIDLAWNEKANSLGFVWNDATNHRSYWATSTDAPVEKDQSWNDANTNGLAAVYCQENTSSDKTKLLFAAQLQDEKGQPIEIAEYFGVRYVGGENAVKAIMLNQLTDYCYSTGDKTYSQLTVDDLTFATATTEEGKSYQVKAHLASRDYTFYTKNGDDYSFVEKVEKAVVEAKIAELKPAMIYKSGMTYYHTAIKHSGAEGAGKFGIVRNHSYQITVNSIAGLGTPVYDPSTGIDPITPTDQNTYIAATINVLKWKIVTQEVNLGE